MIQRITCVRALGTLFCIETF